MKWSGNLPVVKKPRYQQRRNLYMKWSGNLPVVKTPRYQQRRNLYMKWSRNLPVVHHATNSDGISIILSRKMLRYRLPDNC
jgi:hypothetical protein